MCCGHRAATPVVVEVVEVHFIRTVERDTVDPNPIAVALAVAGRMDNRMLVDIVAAHSVGTLTSTILIAASTPLTM